MVVLSRGEGELVRSDGVMAKANPFRFSTKYQDDESDFLYYGYRYLANGRWLNRDPLGELAGVNLYCLVGNDPVNLFDVNGEYTFGEWMQIGGEFGSGAGIGAKNVGTAAWGLIRSPYTVTKSLADLFALASATAEGR